MPVNKTFRVPTHSLPGTALSTGLIRNKTQMSAPKVLRKDEAQEGMEWDQGIILETGYGKGPSEW